MGEVTPNPSGSPTEAELLEGLLVQSHIKLKKRQPTPEELSAIKDQVKGVQQQQGLTDERMGAIRKLFAARPELALATAKNIADLGKTAGQTEIGLQDKAQTAGIDIVRVAGLTDIEIQAIPRKFAATWTGIVDLLGRGLRALGVNFGQTMIDFAEANKPAPIDTKAALARSEQQRTQVKIDERQAAISQWGVWQHALAMTDPKVAGATPEAGAQAHRDIAGVKDNNKQNPYYQSGSSSTNVPADMVAPTSAGPTATPPAAAASSATTANILQMREQLIARAKSEGVTLSEASAGNMVSLTMKVDNDAKKGNRTGIIDTQAELDALSQSATLLSMPKAERDFMLKYAGSSVRREQQSLAVREPAPAAP